MALGLKEARSAPADSRQLWSAIDSDDIDQLEEILAGHSLENCINPHGVTPLLHAVLHNRVKIVRALIEHGADVNAVRADGFSPLLLATFFGYADIVQALLQHGANMAATTRFGTSAKMWATARGFYDIAEYLQQWQDNRVKFALVGAPPMDDRSREKHPRKDLGFEKLEKEVGPSWSTDEIVARPAIAKSATTITTGKREVTERSTEPLVVRRLKEPPEIWDLVHENSSAFKPGSALVSRIRSTKTTTMALMLGVMLCLVIGTVAVIRQRNQRTQSTVTELSASDAPLGTGLGDSSDRKIEVNKDATRPEQSQSFSSPNESPVVKDESAEPSENKLASTGTQVIGSHSTDGSSQPITRRHSKIPQRPGARVANLDSTAGDTAVKNSTPQTLQTAEPGSNKSTPVSVDSTPPKKPSNSSTNSRVITPPFGTSTTKPKTIQWP